MIYSVEQITNALKAARQQKQLTQRELSQKVRLPQSQISKIERGLVDLRLSSLVDLSRALDHELMLIPRKLVPAVQSMTRGARPTVVTGRQVKVLKRLESTAKALQHSHPDLESLRGIQNTADVLRRFRLPNETLARLRESTRALKEIQKQLPDLKPYSLDPAALENIRAMDQSLRRVYRKLADQLALTSEKTRAPLPAYRIDEDQDG